MADNSLGTEDESNDNESSDASTSTSTSSNDERFEALQSSIESAFSGHRNDLQQFGNALVEAVNQRNASPNAPTPDSPASDGNLVDQLLSSRDPDAFLNNLIERGASKVIAEQVAPQQAQAAQQTYLNLTEKHQTAFDNEFGTGAYTELIKPNLEAVLSAMNNPLARGNEAAITTSINAIKGRLFNELNERRTKFQAEGGKSVGDPAQTLGPGRSRSASGSRLSSEDINWIASYEDHTGIDLDKKQLAEILKVRDTSGVWTQANFPGMKRNRGLLDRERKTEKGAQS
jgi:hypothetical protein